MIKMLNAIRQAWSVGIIRPAHATSNVVASLKSQSAEVAGDTQGVIEHMPHHSSYLL